MEKSQPSPETDITNVPLVGMAVNAALAMLKITAGWIGNSYALVADGIESTADIVSSLVVWGGLRIASRPPTPSHPYGYGKAESLAGAIAATAILGAAGVIAVQSIHEIRTPHHLPHWSTLVVLALVVAVKEGLARWIGRAGDAADSSSLQGDAWHHRADAITSAAAFIGISISLIGGPGYEPADDWAALLACGVIAWSGVRLIRRSIREVMDAAPSDSFEVDVRRLAEAVDGVRAVEKCRIRKSGLAYFIEIHIEVDGNLTVHAGHIIGGKVRSALRDSPYRIADAFVHVEPAPTNFGTAP
jgi:cation diffusion facilitator family transporter